MCTVKINCVTTASRQNRVYNLRTLMNKTSWCINSNFLSSTCSFPYLGLSPYAFIKTPVQKPTPSYTLSVFGNGIIGRTGRAHTSQPIGHSYQKMTHFKWQSVLKRFHRNNAATTLHYTTQFPSLTQSYNVQILLELARTVTARKMEALVARGNWNKKIWGVKWKIDEC